jgi:hypothetical protein
LKFTDEKEQDPEPEPDSLVKGVDPRSGSGRIRNTAVNEVGIKIIIFWQAKEELTPAERELLRRLRRERRQRGKETKRREKEQSCVMDPND